MSIELQDFLKKCISPHFTNFKESHFSEKTKQNLSEIFENIKKGEHEYKNAKIISNILDENYIPKGLEYHHCPQIMKTHIESMNSSGRTFTFSILNRKIKIYLIYENERQNKKMFENAIKRIYIILYLLQIYSRKECSQYLSIYLYLTDVKKTLDECNVGTCTIGKKNANTAFTFACIKRNEIYVYRKEEWLKVLIHELFHSFGLDFSEFDCTDIDKKVYEEIFPIKTDLRLYEAYTEMWGEILNIMIHSYLSLKHGEPIEKAIKKTEKLLQKERMFSMFQASKILCHFGLTYNNMFERNEEGYNNRKLFKETTPILSYFIIKNILIFHSNEFLEWCFETNEGSLDFKKTDATVLRINIENFVDFIKKYHNNDLFVSLMEEMRTWFFKKNSICNKNDAFIKTIRMSLLEY